MFNQGKLHQRRAILIISILFLGFLGVGLVIYSFNNNLVFFYSPSEVPQSMSNKVIRVGGMVKQNSVVTKDLRFHEFVITDYSQDLTIRYEGILPNLFKEGQGVVAKGRMALGYFVADEILAKHDENYMPKEVYESLKKRN